MTMMPDGLTMPFYCALSATLSSIELERSIFVVVNHYLDGRRRLLTYFVTTAPIRLHQQSTFNMGWFHALATEQDGIPKLVYHVCPKSQWENNRKDGAYYPKHYDIDKFTRSTFDAAQLTKIANCFYKETSPPGEEWVCLEVDTTGLKVFGIEITLEESAENPDLKCAHIYGGLPQECVRKVYTIQRKVDDGEFLTVKGLADTSSCGCNGSSASGETGNNSRVEL